VIFKKCIITEPLCRDIIPVLTFWLFFNVTVATRVDLDLWRIKRERCSSLRIYIPFSTLDFTWHRKGGRVTREWEISTRHDINKRPFFSLSLKKEGRVVAIESAVQSAFHIDLKRAG
jgi:hypothetical protein